MCKSGSVSRTVSLLWRKRPQVVGKSLLNFQGSVIQSEGERFTPAVPRGGFTGVGKDRGAWPRNSN